MPSILPDTWLDKGSLWMDPEDRIPVTSNFDWENPPVGLASDIQRNEETGEVSVEIRWFDETFTLDEDSYHSSFWATDLEERQVEATDELPEYRLILKAKVRGIGIVPIAANPKFPSQELQAP
jgi:hypothetical protein